MSRGWRSPSPGPGCCGLSLADGKAFAATHVRLDAANIAIPLRLDELKLRAMKQAQRTTSKGVPVKARLVTAILTLALIGGGGGAVIAASGGGNATGNEGAANSQYCPPKSPGAGKPKDPPPGNACGQPNQAPEQTQVATNGGAKSIPFTGLAIFPLLIGGIALAITGGILRRRLDQQS